MEQLRFFLLIAITWAATGLASISIRRAGWLDRMVEYQKKKFYEELGNLPVVHINAKIERAPIGYTDSRDWDYESVIRLMTLIRDSDGAKSVRQALRRSWRPNRRFMSFLQSFKAFPSLSKDHDNNFYYDVDAGEYYADGKDGFNDDLDDENLIVVKNPVEAKLPSARISIKLLKSILENRAKAARYMSTTKKKIPWSKMSTTKTSQDAPKDDKSESSPAPTKVPESETSVGPAVTNQGEEKTTV